MKKAVNRRRTLQAILRAYENIYRTPTGLPFSLTLPPDSFYPSVVDLFKSFRMDGRWHPRRAKAYRAWLRRLRNGVYTPPPVLPKGMYVSVIQPPDFETIKARLN